MKLIGKTNIDFQRVRHLWMTLSGILIIVGLANVILRGGPNYSIDFTGGLSALLRSTAPAGQEQISEEVMRNSLEKVGIEGAEVKTSRSTEGEDLLLRMKQQGRYKPPEAFIRAKLDEKYAGVWHIVPDDQLDSEWLKELTGVSYVAIATEIQTDALKELLNSVDIDNPSIAAHKLESGDSIFILSGEGRDAISRLLKVLRSDYPDYHFEIRSIDLVGPRIGAELRGKAILAIIASWVLIILYLWWRFDFIFGVAAVIALIHDVLVTFAVMSFFDFEISMTVVGAYLTLIGFSVNDTIVVFDRIRENLKRFRDMSLKENINLSINQNLARTLITNGTVLVVVAVLTVFGGEVLFTFSLTMLIGCFVGTYSSIYIAAPILIDYVERTGRPIGRKMKGK
ncbi:MAG: protein translocase subunit SecF [Calditrichaeota bacterium]|nr:protein translocase subunit SecF [Calditrichota bacterium]